MSLTLRLEDELDVSRGETICRPEEAPTVARELEADVCWMAEQPLRPGGRYVIKHTTRNATAVVDAITDHVDVDTLERGGPPAELGLNDIGRVRLRTSAPLVFDPYVEQPAHGQLHPDRRGLERDRRRGDDRGGLTASAWATLVAEIAVSPNHSRSRSPGERYESGSVRAATSSRSTGRALARFMLIRSSRPPPRS